MKTAIPLSPLSHFSYLWKCIRSLREKERLKCGCISNVCTFNAEHWIKETPSTATTTSNRNNKDHYFIAANDARFPRHTFPLENLYWKSCIRVETESLLHIRLLCIEICKWYAPSSKYVCLIPFVCVPESLPTKKSVTVLRIVSTFCSSLFQPCRAGGTWALYAVTSYTTQHNNSMLDACLIPCFPLLLIGYICNSSLRRTNEI